MNGNTLLMIILIIIILVYLPVLISSYYSNANLNNMCNNIIPIAINQAKPNKDVYIFYYDNTYEIIINGKFYSSYGNIIDVLSEMKNNSCVIITVGVLEYYNYDVVDHILNKINDVSGGHYHIINYSNSIRMYWDTRIKTIFSKQYYDNIENIRIVDFSDIQNFTRSIYQYIIPFFILNKN